MEARQLLAEHSAGTAVDKSFVSAVTTKWAPLIEGIQNPYQRGVMGILLENQMDHLKSLNEETLSTGVGSFTKYIFPILRRVFPNLIANQIVSVQPMTAPVGGIFTYEYKYADAKGGTAPNSPNAANESLIEKFERFYSSETIDFELKVVAANTDNAKAVWDDVTNPQDRKPFKWLPVHAVDASKGYGLEFNWTDGGDAKKQTMAAGGTFTGHGTPANTSVNLTTGAWTLDCTGAVPDNNTTIWATYSYNSELVANTTAPGAGINSLSYADADQVAKVPEVNIDITLTTVTAITRKLKARWSAEAADDLRAFHGLNAETELVAGISNEIALELDREIIDDLVNGAKWSASHDLTPAAAQNGSYGNDSLGNIRDLLTMISSVSSKIHVGSMRAPANFIVCSAEIGAMLAQLTTHGDYMMVNRIVDQEQAPGYGPMNSNFGVQRIGTLLNKYAVYQDPFLASTKLLVGLKGSSFLDAGYVYAPYIPLQVTPTFLDPDDFTFRKGLRTRYAKKMLRSEYYGVITVTGLPTVN